MSEREKLPERSSQAGAAASAWRRHQQPLIGRALVSLVVLAVNMTVHISLRACLRGVEPEGRHHADRFGRGHPRGTSQPQRLRRQSLSDPPRRNKPLRLCDIHRLRLA